MIKPLADLTWRDHKSALWWLGLLYRRPHQFLKAFEQLSWRRALWAGLLVLGHALPYALTIAGLFRWLFVGLLDLPLSEPIAGNASTLWVHGAAFLMGIVSGIVSGIVVAAGCSIALGVIFGVAYGTGFGRGYSTALRDTGLASIRTIVSSIAKGIGFGIARGGEVGVRLFAPCGIAAGIALVIGFGAASGIAGSITAITLAIAIGVAGGIVTTFGFGIPIGIALGTYSAIAGGIVFGIVGALGIAGFAIAVLRPYYQFLHLGFVIPALQAGWYRFHPVAWDDMCLLPFLGLHRLLVAYTETSPEAGNAEIERLISSYPSQRMQALRARTTILARQAGAQRDLASLDAIVASLPEGDKGFLRQTSDIRRLVGEIAGEQRRLDAIDRAVLRQPYAALIVSKVEGFRGRVAGFREPLASEFRAAADKWLEIARRQLAELQSITGKDPTPQLFRAGDPVDRSKEAFVARMGVLDQIERQIMLASGCPGLLIYGRRRMGKSTLLRNLDGFLPGSVHIASISMQNPAAFTSLSSLVQLIASEINKVHSSEAALDHLMLGVGRLGADTATPTNLAELYGCLASANAVWESEGTRLILAFDEFEQFDVKIGKGVFSEDLLSTIRESIQMHRQLIWVFAGSHHITELNHAAWDSYFVSLRTVEVPPLSEAETRLLLTEPLKESPLYERDAPRPHYDAAFWGDGGIEWVHEQTAGWPHLVQLLAGTAVDLVNDANVAALDRAMLEKAAQRAIVDGDTVLRQLMRGESQLSGEWDYLTGFRSKDAQLPPQDEGIFQSLRHRQLITEEGGTWRLRVPLMQRWLRARG